MCTKCSLVDSFFICGDYFWYAACATLPTRQDRKAQIHVVSTASFAILSFICRNSAGSTMSCASTSTCGTETSKLCSRILSENCSYGALLSSSTLSSAICGMSNSTICLSTHCCTRSRGTTDSSRICPSVRSKIRSWLEILGTLTTPICSQILSILRDNFDYLANFLHALWSRLIHNMLGSLLLLSFMWR